MKLIPLPAFQANDPWVLHDGSRALLVDPGDAHPVRACLQRDRLQLGAILVTHHHLTRLAAVDALRADIGAAVWRPAGETARGSRETGFSAGCRQPHRRSARRRAAGDKPASLPGATQVCCTHEYAPSKRQFARAAEPRRAKLINSLQRGEELRATDLPVPFATARDRRTNPFLRMRLEAVAQVARAHDAATQPDPASVFATLRHSKNEFT